MRSAMVRPRSLAQVAAVALVALAGVPSAASAAPDESVAYQVSTGHTGFASGGSLDRPPLDTRWTRTLGLSPPGTDSDGYTSYPLVADGRVFVIAYDSQHAGGTLVALDSLTGTTLWSRGVDGPGQIAYDDGRVFVSEGSGTVVAVSADTGATDWARVLPESFQLQMPVAADGVVYVDSAWDGGGLYALSATDGSTKWFTSQWTEGTPALAGGFAYVSDDYEGVTFAVSTLDGSTAWTGTSQCFVGSGHVVADGARVIGPWNSGCGSLVDAATGAELNSIASSASPAVAGDIAVVLDGSTLEGRSQSTGLLLWQFAGDGSLRSAPVIVNDTVYEGSSTGVLFAVDLRTGTAVWSGSIATDGTVAGGAGLAVGGGLLVVPSGGTITGLESTTPARPGLDLTIDSGPDGPTTSDVAALSFGSSDTSVPERCRLDGAPWKACAGSATYAGLADGPHMFEVRTVDQSDGSTIGLAVRGWSVYTPATSGGTGGGTGSTSTPPSEGSAGSTVTAPVVTPAAVADPAPNTVGSGSTGGSTTGSSTPSSRDSAIASTALARLADATLARSLADAGAALLRGRTHAQVRARPSVHLYSRGAEQISIVISYKAKGRTHALATASTKFAATGSRNVRLALTATGRAALAHRGRLSLVVRATVTPVVGAPSSASASARI